jgi:hypothetical protein
VRWCTPVILATWEAQKRRIAIARQPFGGVTGKITLIMTSVSASSRRIPARHKDY